MARLPEVPEQQPDRDVERGVVQHLGRLDKGLGGGIHHAVGPDHRGEQQLREHDPVDLPYEAHPHLDVRRRDGDPIPAHARVAQKRARGETGRRQCGNGNNRRTFV